MALSDPLAITIGTAQSLPRVSSAGYTADYQTADKTLHESIKHSPSAKRTRSVVRVDQNKIAADPLTSLNTRISGSAYLVLDFPLDGFSETEKVNIVTGLFNQLTTGTNAMLKKVIGLES